MKKTIYLVLLFTTVILSQSNEKEVKTVDKVDLKKYIGLWYEIAKIPNRFQTDCIKNTTAEYFFDEDGNITVRNSCMQIDGEMDVANGLAKVVDEKTFSKLKVSFVSILGIRLFWGDYWIIGLGKTYDYAVVVSPNRKYGWILSRTKKLPQSTIDEAFKILTEQGFEKNNFVFSVQD